MLRPPVLLCFFHLYWGATCICILCYASSICVAMLPPSLLRCNLRLCCDASSICVSMLRPSVFWCFLHLYCGATSICVAMLPPSVFHIILMLICPSLGKLTRTSIFVMNDDQLLSYLAIWKTYSQMGKFSFGGYLLSRFCWSEKNLMRLLLELWNHCVKKGPYLGTGVFKWTFLTVWVPIGSLFIF